MKLWLFIVLLGLFLAPASAQNKLSRPDRAAIEQIEKNFEAAWLKNDETGVLALFWDDAMLYPNGNVINGIEGIKKFWFTPSDTVHTLTKYEIKLSEIAGEKNLAYSVGTHEIAWDATTKGQPEVKRFVATRYFMAIYAKRHKQWKILKRHWSGKLQEVK